MKYFPDNLVTVDYVLATLQNYQGETAQVQAEVRTEAIQKLGMLAFVLGTEMQTVAEAYSISVDKERLTQAVSAIATAVAAAVPNPIVQGVATIATLSFKWLGKTIGKETQAALARVQEYQLKLQRIQAVMADLQTKEKQETTTNTTFLLIVVIVVLYLIAN